MTSSCKSFFSVISTPASFNIREPLSIDSNIYEDSFCFSLYFYEERAQKNRSLELMIVHLENQNN